jgi:hypothetical protein
MDLIEAIDRFCGENLSEHNNWYDWKFNESLIPIDSRLLFGNPYSKNIILKHELHNAWKNEPDRKKKAEIIKYYIKVWGGIKRNSDNLMEKYSTNPHFFIDLGKKGIASWSKALVIHDPNKYAIFDARVSISLNYLQLKFNTSNKVLYPILGSQNKKITESGQQIKLKAKADNWGKVNSSTFYSDYLKILDKVSKSRNTNISTIEMLLFAKSEFLVDEMSILV